MLLRMFFTAQAYLSVLATLFEGSMHRDNKIHFCPRTVGKGIANELSSFRSSLVFAMKMKGSLCLPSFVDGKTLSRKFQRRTVGLSDIFDVEFLVRKLQVRLVDCNTSCHNPCTSLDLSTMKALLPKGEASVEHILQGKCRQVSAEETKFVELNPWISLFQSCIEDYIILQKYLRSPQPIRELAQEVIANVFHSKEFLALHWRFEETKCRGFLGTCVRSLFATTDHFTVTQGQLKLAIGQFISSMNQSSTHLYVASDACLRGKCQLLRDTLTDYQTFSATNLLHFLNSRGISWSEASLEFAILEQEICAYSRAFMGMSYSTWSHEIFLKRSILNGDIPLARMILSLSSRQREYALKWHHDSSDGFFDLQLLNVVRSTTKLLE